MTDCFSSIFRDSQLLHYLHKISIYIFFFGTVEFIKWNYKQTKKEKKKITNRWKLKAYISRETWIKKTIIQRNITLKIFERREKFFLSVTEYLQCYFGRSFSRQLWFQFWFDSSSSFSSSSRFFPICFQ